MEYSSTYIPNNPRPIHKVRIAVPTKNMLQLYKDKKQFVEFGKNHHIEIFENNNLKRDFRIVPMYDAVQRKKTGQDLIDKTPIKEGYEFLISLGINELVLIDVKKGDIDWENPITNRELGTQLFRVQKIDKNGVIQFCHHTVSVADYNIGKIAKTYNSFLELKLPVMK